MNETMIVFMTGALLSFPVLYWMLDRMTRRQRRTLGPARSLQGSDEPAGSAFQRLLVCESLDRVLRWVDDLQREVTTPDPPVGALPLGRPTTLLSAARRQSLAECMDLVNALLADEDAREIRAALSRLEQTTTRDEFLQSLGTARETVVELRHDLVDTADGAARPSPS